MKRYFITGTDTDCGKTYITAQLSNYLSHTEVMKPVASGCEQEISADAQYLQRYSRLSLDVINPWRLKLPVSPHIAAQREGVVLSASEIADYCLHWQGDGVHRLLIEGAGGLMVPLNEHETWIDFLKISDISVILVVGMKLGCINHALLTGAVLKAHGIASAGWIANCIDPHMLNLAENIDTLVKKLHMPLLTVVPFSGDILSLEQPL